MDFLDSLDLDVSYKRSRRVRSWYLYEQLKSLEQNQIDAALRLRDRSFQDQVLRQELSERRDRRTLCTRSRESRDSLLSRQRSVKSDGADSIHNGSIDDLFLSFSELYDSGFAASVVADDLSEQSSHEDAAVEDECKSLGEQEENTSVVQSMQSVVCVESDGTITGYKDHCYEECEDNCVHSPCEEICEEQVPHDSHDTVVDEINYYFDELKDNLEQIEKLAEYDCDICDEQRIESDSGCSVEEELPVIVINKKSSVHAKNKNIITLWSKVVSFAHQVVELNHGNCYSDYGSQIMTAVLACDVLCRGISKICEILQPFVCPVRNCASSDSDCSDCYCYKREKRKTKHIPKRGRCRCTNKPFKRNSIVHITRTYCSDNWQHPQNTTAANRTNTEKGRRMSEPYTMPIRSQKLFSKRNSKKSYEGSFINEFSYDTSKDFFVRKNNRPQCKMLNDIMKLSQYFDNILKDIEESMQVSNL